MVTVAGAGMGGLVAAARLREFGVPTVVVEKGQGVQTGDAVKLEVEEDEEPPPAPKADEKKAGDKSS